MKQKSKKRSVALRVSLDGIIAALAITLSFIENMLPDMAFMPPGAKLGLSNIAVMFAVTAVGYADGTSITLIKSGFVFLTRGPAAFFMSFSGGILSCITLIAISAVTKKLNKEFSYIGVSVICAVMHNIGQISAASVYMKTNLVSSYLPLLLVFGVIAGIITGLVLKTAMPALLKLSTMIGVEKI